MPFFSDMGLVAEGRDASRQFEQKLSDEQDVAQLRKQAIESGNMGLEDARRERGTQAKARAAGGAAGSVSQSLRDMADVHLKAGDPVTANKFMDADKGLRAEGLTDVTHLLLTKPDAGFRPDVAEVFNAKGAHKIYSNPNDPNDPKNPQFDGKGTLMVTNEKTGKREPIDIGKVAILSGMVKPPTPLKLEPGAKAVNPVTGAEIANNPSPDQYDIKDGVIFSKRSGKWEQVGAGEWKLGHIVNGNQEVPVRINDKTGTVEALGPGGVRSNMEAKIVPSTTPGGPTMIALPGGGVAEFKPATEATPGKTNWLSPNEPGKPGQPAQVVPVGQPETPPMQGAQKAPDGKWYVKQGDKWAPVIVGGQPATPKAAAPVAETVPEAGNSGAPAPTAPAKPAAKPTAKPAAKGRQYDDDLERKNPQLKRLGDIARLGSQDPNVDVKLWLAYVAKAQELGSDKFASRNQKAGLGG